MCYNDVPEDGDLDLEKFKRDITAVYDRNAIRVLLQACGQVAEVNIPPRPLIMAALANQMLTTDRK